MVKEELKKMEDTEGGERRNSARSGGSIYTVRMVVASLDRVEDDGKSIGSNSVWGHCGGTNHPKLPLPHADGFDRLHDRCFSFRRS